MDYPTVRVHQGLLRGIYEVNLNGKRFVAFRGVPYAQPPVGDRRFQDSEPMEPWAGVKDATEFGGRCAQKIMSTGAVVGSDDCLYLNIYTSTLEPSSPRAVMVWIHGGIFVFGSGNDDIHGPDYLIERDIVLVTINYRLGILGFLNVEDEDAPGNQGLKDQVQALKWIQQNISAFGGDSSNVTIFGESAGGASVHYLCISPLSQGLFHKAIVQSGVASNPWAFMASPPMEVARKLAVIEHQDISDPKKFIKYLKTLDVRRLIELEYQLQTHMDKKLFLFLFGPSIDAKAKNSFLSVPLEEALKEGIKVPCILGYVSHEGIIMVAGMTDEDIDEINSHPEHLLVHPTAKKLLKRENITVNDLRKVYFNNEIISKKNINEFVDLATFVLFTAALHDILEQQAKILSVPTYVYKLEYSTEDAITKKLWNITELHGACHGEDLNFLFYPKIHRLCRKIPAEVGSTEHNTIRRFTQLWTDFAKTGTPNVKTTKLIPVIWKPIDDSMKYNTLIINKNLRICTESNVLHQLKEKIKNNI